MDRLEEIKERFRHDINICDAWVEEQVTGDDIQWLIEQAEGVSLANRELGKWILECEEKNKRISELEEAIEKHNSACEETCDMWREQGQQCGYQEYIEQSEYMARKACAADCPREWVIKP